LGKLHEQARSPIAEDLEPRQGCDRPAGLSDAPRPADALWAPLPRFGVAVSVPRRRHLWCRGRVRRRGGASWRRRILGGIRRGCGRGRRGRGWRCLRRAWLTKRQGRKKENEESGQSSSRGHCPSRTGLSPAFKLSCKRPYQ
jgi:hypothetical protein